MLRATQITVLLLLAFASGQCLAGDPAPMDVLKRALKAHDGVKDYTATVKVEAKIPDSHIPVRTAKVYVKRPDKVYIESEGVIFLPKRALLFGDLAKEVEKDATAVLVGKRAEGADTVYCIKLIPKDTDEGSGKTVRFLAWVRSGRWTVEKVQVTSEAQVVAGAQFTYQKVGRFWMPIHVFATAGGVRGTSGKEATIDIRFSDYRINIGLTDEFMDAKIAQAKQNEQDRPRRLRHHHPGERR